MKTIYDERKNPYLFYPIPHSSNIHLFYNVICCNTAVSNFPSVCITPTQNKFKASIAVGNNGKIAYPACFSLSVYDNANDSVSWDNTIAPRWCGRRSKGWSWFYCYFRRGFVCPLCFCTFSISLYDLVLCSSTKEIIWIDCFNMFDLIEFIRRNLWGFSELFFRQAVELLRSFFFVW